MKFRENLSVRRRFLLVALLIVALMVVAMSLFLVHKRNATPRELAHINALCSKDIQRAKTLFIAAKKREKTYDEDGRWFLKFLSLKLKVKENSDLKMMKKSWHSLTIMKDMVMMLCCRMYIIVRVACIAH